MEEYVKKFENKNGNITYTVKELVKALHEKVDHNFERFDERLDNVCQTMRTREECAKLRDRLTKMIYGMFGSVITILAVIIGYLFTT